MENSKNTYKEKSKFRKWAENHPEAIFFMGFAIGLIIFYTGFILWAKLH